MPESRADVLWRRVLAGSARAWARVRADAWLLLQRTAAATIAWLIALRLSDHPDPFFAPIAAVVSLNTTLGERGLNALRLLTGVLVGIGAGELTVLALGGGYGTLAIATFAAMAGARALGGPPIVVAQAASGAILTVAVANGQGGVDRLVDALIGAGVALIFSQLLFTPEPLRLLHRAESAVLDGMASGLHLTARALATDDSEEAAEAANAAMQQLRDQRDRLSALAKTRVASTRVARHSLAWRGHLHPAVREQENAGHLDLLGVSCLTLTRTALAAGDADRTQLVGIVDQIGDLLADLATAPGESATRQSVVDRVPGVLEELARIDTTSNPGSRAAASAVQTVLGDVLMFAGVDADDAAAVLREKADEVRVPASSPAGRIPFLSQFWRWPWVKK